MELFWIISNASSRYADAAGEIGKSIVAVADGLSVAVVIAVAVAVGKAIVVAIGTIVGGATCCAAQAAKYNHESYEE